jgi:hypothetical protein
MNTPAFGNSLSGLERSDYLTGIFQVSDFPKPAVGQNGDLGRNTFFGPGYAGTDFNIVKKTKIPAWSETANIQFRAEFYNVFNRVNLQQPASDITSSNFGRSTATFSPRVFQFGFRIEF